MATVDVWKVDGTRTLIHSKLCAGMSAAEIDRILSRARLRSFQTDDRLFMQGQIARTLLLIRSGSIKVSKVLSSGREVILWVHGPLELAGCLSGQVSPSYPASGVAMSSGSAYTWEVEALLREFPGIASSLHKIAVRRMHELEDRMAETMTMGVSERLANIINRMAVNDGFRCEEGIAIPMSGEELAQVIGTTLESVSRVLSHWSRQGKVTIRRKRRTVIVHNPKNLFECVPTITEIGRQSREAHSYGTAGLS